MAVTTITKVGAFTNDVATQINDNFTAVGTGGTFASPAISGTVTGGASYTAPTLTSPTITGTTAIGSGATLTSPAVVAPTITGAATMASGAVLTTPTVLFTASAVTATGVTGTNAAALSAVTPVLVTTTGASGAGIALPTGAAVPGSIYFIRNINTTGVCNVYAVGGTINGTTGTTPYAMDTTGTDKTWIMCVTAGAWQTGPATT